MSTFIGKPIMPKLLTRFGSQQGDDAKMVLLNTVAPTIDVAPLMSSLQGQEVASTTTTRSDLYSVPIGKKWTLRNATMTRTNAATCDILAVKPDGTDFIIYSTGASTVSVVNLNSLNIYLPSGWGIRFDNGTGTSGSIGTTILYDEYDEYG